MSVNLGFALAIILGEVAPALILLYAAYWAFEIRKALASPLRRNLALWQGAVTSIFALTVFVTYSPNFAISVAIAIFYSVAFVVFFAYIDSLVRVARRSDPLLRDIIHWEKTRYVGWIGVGLIAVFNALSVFFPNSILVGVLVVIAIAVPFVIGGAGILVGSTRIKDPVLKGNLKWLGLALVFVILAIIVGIVEAFAGLSNYEIYYSYPALIGGAIDILCGYCLYKSARSLAPISHFPLDEDKQKPTMP